MEKVEKEKLIACFQDTLEKSQNGSMIKKTARAIKSNRIYKEGFTSNIQKHQEKAFVDVRSETTFETAKKYCKMGKVAVLNFANPERPGGGVDLGAMAQEECLCRSSNLYLCISNQNIFDEYYAYHRRNKKNYFYSDRLIYTKDITVFKDDSLVPQLLPESEQFDVDVITCAAPCLVNRKYTNGAALLLLFKSRIKNILEAARDNNVDVIILGAFGCGAFKNPPRLVAQAFRQVICENNYLQAFKQIVFSIKPAEINNPNIDAFVNEFQSFLSNHYCVPPDEMWRFHKNPALPTESRFAENINFQSWQMNNQYFGKQFSILGDSISTLDGYNPKEYKIFYTSDNCTKANVSQMSDTWWDKVISFFGGELLVNNSWSGSRVTKLKNREQLFPSGCSNERTSSLHINDVKPDVILIYLGTNDWAFGAKTGDEPRILEEDDNEFFDFAYNNMLKKLRKNYPQCEIWCCTLCETYMAKRPDFKFPHKYAGTHIEEYNEIIHNAAIRNNCRLINLYNYNMAYDSIDGSHPTQSGMNTIATMIIRSIVGTDADQFLDCEDNQHNYKISKEYTGDTRYICSYCGKTIYAPMKCPENQHNYEIYRHDWDGNYYRCKKCGKEKFCPSEMSFVDPFIDPSEMLIVEQEKNANNKKASKAVSIKFCHFIKRFIDRQ